MSEPTPPKPPAARRVLLIALPAIILLAGITLLLLPHQSESAPALVGTILKPKPAPAIALNDQFGRHISLAQFKGRPVILTFMQATCTNLCPVVTQTIRRSVTELGKAGKRIAIVAVSADPEHDTISAVRKYSAQHGLLHRWYYLLGTRKQLKPIWRAYYLYVAPANAPKAVRDSHTSATYLIDAQGRERVLMAGDPDTNDLQHDLQILSGLPVRPVGAYALPAPQVGHPAPDFTLRSLAGSTIRLKDLRGKVVLLNFWATWCDPCRSEAPMISRWYQRLQKQGLTVIGVDQQESSSQVASFVRRYHLSYPIAIDTDGSVGANYDVAGLPKSLLIDPQGTIAQVSIGQLDTAFLRQHVLRLLRATNGA